MWVLTILALVLGPSVARADSPSFAGTYRFEGGAREDAVRRAAIDRAVGEVFFALRPIARHKLLEATAIPAWVSFAFGPGQIRTKGPDGVDFATPNNGSPVVVALRGESYRTTQRLAGTTFIQRFACDDGTGQNEWSMSADQSMLTVKVTLSSPHLPNAITYTLTYKRAF
jgi:hypothetical protein